MNHSPNIHAHTKAHILKTGRMARSTQGFNLTRRTSHHDARPLFNGVRDERLMRTDSICDLWSKSDPWAAHYSPGGLWWTCMCVRVWECESVSWCLCLALTLVTCAFFPFCGRESAVYPAETHIQLEYGWDSFQTDSIQVVNHTAKNSWSNKVCCELLLWISANLVANLLSHEHNVLISD